MQNENKEENFSQQHNKEFQHSLLLGVIINNIIMMIIIIIIVEAMKLNDYKDYLELDNE